MVGELADSRRRIGFPPPRTSEWGESQLPAVHSSRLDYNMRYF